MWCDDSNWDDRTFWSDTETLDHVTEAKTNVPNIQATRRTEIISTDPKPSYSVITATTITNDTELEDVIPAGYMLDKIAIEETAGNACVLKIGSTVGGSDLVGSTSCGASAITNISVGIMLSTSVANSVFIGFTSGSGYSVNVYLSLIKMFNNG
jgi:hypothetical protein